MSDVMVVGVDNEEERKHELVMAELARRCGEMTGAQVVYGTEEILAAVRADDREKICVFEKIELGLSHEEKSALTAFYQEREAADRILNRMKKYSRNKNKAARKARKKNRH